MITNLKERKEKKQMETQAKKINRFPFTPKMARPDKKSSPNSRHTTKGTYLMDLGSKGLSLTASRLLRRPKSTLSLISRPSMFTSSVSCIVSFLGCGDD
jgi:hypothetical protein